VATRGPAYLLKASNSKDNLELADFNRPVEVVPPPNAFPVPAR
jgi:hypothetical protein